MAKNRLLSTRHPWFPSTTKCVLVDSEVPRFGRGTSSHSLSAPEFNKDWQQDKCPMPKRISKVQWTCETKQRAGWHQLDVLRNAGIMGNWWYSWDGTLNDQPHIYTLMIGGYLLGAWWSPSSIIWSHSLCFLFGVNGLSHGRSERLPRKQNILSFVMLTYQNHKPLKITFN